jgi:hypothetical protein
VTSGPAIIDTPSANAGGLVATGSLASTGAYYTFTGSNDNSTVNVVAPVKIKLTGTGTVVVNTYYDAAGSSTTPLETFTIYSTSSCDSGTYDAASSSAELLNSTATASAQDTDGDATGTNLQTYSDDAFIALWLADKYGNSLTDTGKYLTATATGGAYVGWATTPAASTAIKTSGIKNAVLTVTNGAAGTTAPVSTTVTIKLNDTVVATKSIVFTGYASKITLGTVPAYVGINTASTDTQSISYTVTDAAGNRVAATAVAGSSTANTNSGGASNFYTTAAGTSGGGATTTAAGYFDITGGSVKGASVTTIRVLRADGTYAVSDPIKYATVTTGLATFTVTTDKKTYSPGEVVTVTITGKNSDNEAVADGTALGGTIAVTTTGLTAVATAPAASDKSVGGVWSYKYYASTTVASYGISVKTSSATVTTGDVTATFSVASAGSSEIAQLVKVIGTLLTTFTKQITALIKALKR